jgi:hypothetical protein
MERLMQQNTVTLIVAGLGIFGTLTGILVGHLLSRSWQREQARLDNKKQEYRELMTSMADGYTQLLRLGSGIVARSPEAQAEIDAARYNSLRTIHDRIYIADRIRELKLFENWTTEMAVFWNSPFGQTERLRFTDRFLALQDLVRSLAIEDTQPRGLVGRMFSRFRSKKNKHGNP